MAPTGRSPGHPASPSSRSSPAANASAAGGPIAPDRRARPIVRTNWGDPMRIVWRSGWCVATMPGMTAAPSPRATKARTPDISPPSQATTGSNPGSPAAPKTIVLTEIALARHDKRDVGQVRDADRFTCGEPVAGTDREDDVLVGERDRADPVMRHGKGHQRQVDLVPFEQRNQLLRAGLRELERHARMCLVERAERRRQERPGQRRGPPDPQGPPSGLASSLARRRTCSTSASAWRATGSERGSRRCQPDTAGQAFKQLDTEIALETVELRRQ